MRLAFTVAGRELVCTVADETLSQRYAQPFDAARVAGLGREAIAILVRGNRARSLDGVALADLRQVGEQLFRALVPEPVRAELAGRRGALLTELDDHLVAVPWELLHDGDRFLCRRFDLGRSVATAQARRGQIARTVSAPVRVLVLLCDPRGDLPGIEAEGEAIAAELDRHPHVRARVTRAPTVEMVRRQLKDYDIVHFAGHADYVAGAPEQGGWHLQDGKLAASEIAALGGGRPMPLLVISNACQSGHTEPWRDDSTARVFGLANAFLLAGTRHYLGTQWEVIDGQSASFAAALYAELALGTTIGAAVRRAREAVIARGGEGDLAWASYVLYGDPSFAPLARAAPPEIEIPSGRELEARASAPWKRPRGPAPLVARTSSAAPLAPRSTPRSQRSAALRGAAVGALATALAAAALFSQCAR